MLRKLLGSLVLSTVAVTFVAGGEYTGKITKVEGSKKGPVTITVKVKSGDDTKDVAFDVPPLAKIFGAGAEVKGKKRLVGIGALVDMDVTITTEKKKVKDEEKEVVTKVQAKK